MLLSSLPNECRRLGAVALTSSAHRHISLDVEKLAEQLSRKEEYLPLRLFFNSLKEIIQLGEDLTSRNSSRITQLFCQTRL
ncbi:hypothetical protein G5714_020392 [Onychostoma macrolepis]|uniref:Uncharacterized protein n=1 Tax=Onychostoma macrolepis TaxID=369639 RepID=A0A7J6BXI4_9TELE|nr:hypothetical protein G5714_020392 [Onychostoma macrolepis]